MSLTDRGIGMEKRLQDICNTALTVSDKTKHSKDDILKLQVLDLLISINSSLCKIEQKLK